MQNYTRRAVIHFAAEFHRGRSISGPEASVQTNVVGIFTLLRAVQGDWTTLDEIEKEAFRFLCTSTGEVFGRQCATGSPFSNVRGYMLSSPYSAFKAA